VLDLFQPPKPATLKGKTVAHTLDHGSQRKHAMTPARVETLRRMKERGAAKRAKKAGA
jgi:hypothetical protein